MSAPSEWPGYIQSSPPFKPQLVSAQIVATQSQSQWWVPRVAVSFRAPGAGDTVHFVAASPPERRASSAGSCLPFASEQQAMQGTPNRGSAQADATGTFHIQVHLPNSYYYVGTLLVPPSIHVFSPDGQKRAVLPLPKDLVVPYRALTYGERWNEVPGGSNVPADSSQATILYANSYPQTFIRRFAPAKV